LIALFISLDILALCVVPLGLVFGASASGQVFDLFLGKVGFFFGAIALVVGLLLFSVGLSEDVDEQFYRHLDGLVFAYLAFEPLVEPWLVSVAGVLVPLFWEMEAFWAALLVWMVLVPEKSGGEAQPASFEDSGLPS